jgi:ribosomal protein L22
VATAAPDRQLVRAQAKWVRMSARKGRVVAEHIRGRSVPEARAVLAFTTKEAAGELEKVLQSAVSNAEANHGIAEDNLYISAAYVDGGPVMKRWRARARGRVARIKKRTCHITVTLTDRAPQAVVQAPPPSGCASRRGRPGSSWSTSAAAPCPKPGPCSRSRTVRPRAKWRSCCGRPSRTPRRTTG